MNSAFPFNVKILILDGETTSRAVVASPSPGLLGESSADDLGLVPRERDNGGKNEQPCTGGIRNAILLR